MNFVASLGFEKMFHRGKKAKDGFLPKLLQTNIVFGSMCIFLHMFLAELHKVIVPCQETTQP